MKTICIVLISFLISSIAQAQESNTKFIDFAEFGRVALVFGPGLPQHLILFATGDGGFDFNGKNMAETMLGRGTVVVAFNPVNYYKAVKNRPGDCLYPAADLTRLSDYVATYLKMPSGQEPVLVGHSLGASLAYIAFLQALPGTFAGAIGISLCPNDPLEVNFCDGARLQTELKKDDKGDRLKPSLWPEPKWFVLQGDKDTVCSYKESKTFQERMHAPKLITMPGAGHIPAVWKREFDGAMARLIPEEPVRRIWLVPY